MRLPAEVERLVLSTREFQNRAVRIRETMTVLGGGTVEIPKREELVLRHEMPNDGVARLLFSVGVTFDDFHGDHPCLSVSLVESGNRTDRLQLGATDFWPRPLAGLERVAVRELSPVLYRGQAHLDVELRNVRLYGSRVLVQLVTYDVDLLPPGGGA